MTRKAIGLILCAAALIAVPLVVTNEFYLNLASQILIYALLAVSLNLLLSYGGMVSLGHASFVGLTSYAAVLLLDAGFGQLLSAILAVVFCLGAVLAGLGGTLGAPMLNAYPGLDTDMLPLALIVVILGGAGSLLGAFVGSFMVGFLYNFGIALFPDLAYFILFLPMVLVLVFMPQGLFGRVPS